MAYEPGVCNIGPKEIKKRKAMGWIFLLFSVLLIIGFLTQKIAHVWRVTLFIPVLLAALGFLQAHREFCVYYGMKSLHNAHDGKPEKTHDIEDKKESGLILFQAVIIAAMVTLIVLILK